MKFSDRLFAENKALWQRYLEHPFIKGMQNGTLPIAAFRYYMLQDYLYLKEYAKVFAIGLSKTTNPVDVAQLSASLSAITWETDHVHTQYMQRIGITEQDIANCAASLSNIGYTSYMLAAAQQGDVLNAYAAVLSCSWSYGYIGKEIYRATPQLAEDNLYGEWLKAYSSDEYQVANRGLMDIFDQRCANLTEPRLAELAEIFRICSQFELRFWDMAYTMGQSDVYRAE